MKHRIVAGRASLPRGIQNLPIYLALLAVCLLFLFPFYWVVVSSLKSVAGMNLEPPAMIPAEQLTVNFTVNAKDRMYRARGSDWFFLSNNAMQFTTSTSEGAYCLQIDKGKPTKLAKWLTKDEMSPVADGQASIRFENLPVILVRGMKYALLTRMVRQNDTTFDELLFTVPSSDTSAVDRVTLVHNVPHEDIRYFSAHVDNFSKALKGPEATIGGESSGFLLFMRNSFMIALLAVIGQILSSSLVAFAFARLTFKGRDTLFVILLATLMVPAQVTLIPLFSIYKSVGWIDSFLPLIVPHFTAGAFNVFLIRQFMLGLPRELDESAEIDGASPLRTFKSIVLPNCKPVLIVVGLFTFVAAWQDVMGPLIYLDSPARRTVSLGLEYFRSPYVDNRPLLMAGALLSMLPVAIIFLFVQRYILAGIATTGMKT